MKRKMTAPYGAWRSPITAEAIAAGSIGLDQLCIDGPDLCWMESRPLEGGRWVVLRRSRDGQVVDQTPSPFNVRSRVNEYGGGAYVPDQGVVYFVHLADQRIYRQDGQGPPMPLTPEGTGMRYADLVIDRRRRRILAVREDCPKAGRKATDSIVMLSVAGSNAGCVLASGHNFCASPRLSPDGALLAWLVWDHPHMPWDSTELWIGRLNDTGMLTETMKVAGGLGESVQQPSWSPGGDLYFVSDRSGWWNLYRWRQGTAEPVCPKPADFGRPPWVFGQSSYDFLSNTRIVCTFVENGIHKLAMVDTVGSGLQSVETDFTEIGSLRAWEGKAVFLGSSPSCPMSIVELDPLRQEFHIMRQPVAPLVDRSSLSIPVAIEFPTGKAEHAHAFYYPAANPLYQAPPGELPPLLVKCHGGPTGAASTRFNLGIQYWTSRGFVVLDVNYRGSTGFGRAYRDRIKGEWGIADVEDCIQGASYLASKGLVDPQRMAITGSSAGGFTVLCALAFHQVFKTGASYYGISDLELLQQNTHKFESHYLETLIGPYPGRRDIYLARSPIHWIQKMKCPVILFQGMDDPVVPPAQAEMMAEALRRRGIPVAYLAFEGEQHGFRRAENIRRCLEAELYFYGRIFGFPVADSIMPVPIENLDPSRAGREIAND